MPAKHSCAIVGVSGVVLMRMVLKRALVDPEGRSAGGLWDSYLPHGVTVPSDSNVCLGNKWVALHPLLHACLLRLPLSLPVFCSLGPRCPGLSVSASLTNTSSLLTAAHSLFGVYAAGDVAVRLSITVVHVCRINTMPKLILFSHSQSSEVVGYLNAYPLGPRANVSPAASLHNHSKHN
jgi:hypothetical protein